MDGLDQTLCVRCLEDGVESKVSVRKQDHSIPLKSGFPYFGADVTTPNVELEICDTCGMTLLGPNALSQVEFSINKRKKEILLFKLNETLVMSERFVEREQIPPAVTTLVTAISILKEALKINNLV